MKKIEFIIIFKELHWCNICKSLRPKENNLNGSLFSLLNFAAVRLTDDGNASQSPKHRFKSIFYWIKCLEYCTLELYSGKWLSWCFLFDLSFDLSQHGWFISNIIISEMSLVLSILHQHSALTIPTCLWLLCSLRL